MRYLGDDWRPDRCGVLIGIVGGEGGEIPAGFPQAALKFDIVDSPRVLAWDPLIGFIASEIQRGRPVFLGIPAPVGYERRKVFLNDLLAAAVASCDRIQMINGLMAAFQLGVRDEMKEKTIFD